MDLEPETGLKPRTVPAAVQAAQRGRGGTEVTPHRALGSVDLVLPAVFAENLAGKPALQVPSSRAAARGLQGPQPAGVLKMTQTAAGPHSQSCPGRRDPRYRTSLGPVPPAVPG